MVKILFNEKRIFVTDNYNALQSAQQLNNAQIVFDCNKEKLLASIDLLMISELENMILVGNINDVLNIIKSAFTNIVAGGGVVKNSKDEYLFIYRRGRWDLPKGKSEEGEVIEKCALREVREETGIRYLQLNDFLCTTYHLYFDEKIIFKETYWFLMSSDDRSLKPQQEEGIKKAVWIYKGNMSKQLGNTYESIKDIFNLILPV